MGASISESTVCSGDALRGTKTRGSLLIEIKLEHPFPRSKNGIENFSVKKPFCLLTAPVYEELGGHTVVIFASPKMALISQ